MDDDYKIYAVDFDGTIVSNKYPDIGEPNWPLINKLKAIHASGDKLILWTCRTDRWLVAALDFCDSIGLEFCAINSNDPLRMLKYKNDCRKIGADYYIDDKAVNVKDFIGGNYGESY